MRLPDGLVLRRGRSEDRGAVLDWVEEAFVSDDGEPDRPLLAWVSDLFDRPHPAFAPDHWLLVVEEATGVVAAGLCVFPQTWAYAGMPLGVWRIEIVGSRTARRRQGLIRLLMDEIHRAGEAEGVDAFVITGIPWLYRRFGYDMAIPFLAATTVLTDGLPDEPASEYAVSPAVADDAAFLADLHREDARHWLVSGVQGEASWRHLVAGSSHDSVQRTFTDILERDDREIGAVTYFIGPSNVWAPWLALADGESWSAAGEALLCRLRDVAALHVDSGRVKLGVPADHPVLQALPHHVAATEPPYAWYVRAPDVPGLLGRVAPVLAGNLAASPSAGWSGSVRISWPDGGVEITVEQGAVTAEAWSPERIGAGDVFLPDHLVVSLVFGRLAFGTLRTVYPDVMVSRREVVPVVEALFPARSSLIVPLA